jgi:heptosyltransferase-1
MPRILLVKTSSLGDVVHNLPVVSDIRTRWPDAVIDWVVEEAFADIPRLHPDVVRVLPVAIRRWRKSLLSRQSVREIARFHSLLWEQEYDLVIDTQGLLKSALIARHARTAYGGCVGLDWPSSREPLRCFYDRTFHVPWGRHAVLRNRELAARALGYDEPGDRPDYGIHAPQVTLPWLRASRHTVLLHATSAANKLWPESHWVNVCKLLFSNDIFHVLPWGSEDERARSERLARHIPNAMVAPRMSLNELAVLCASAVLVLGVDTGLTHLAAALGAPTIGLYCATDPAATGVYGAPRASSLGHIGVTPDVEMVAAAAKALL